eukprot:352096-Chlamydomonas_euryale.AAC.4
MGKVLEDLNRKLAAKTAEMQQLAGDIARLNEAKAWEVAILPQVGMTATFLKRMPLLVPLCTNVPYRGAQPGANVAVGHAGCRNGAGALLPQPVRKQAGKQGSKQGPFSQWPHRKLWLDRPQSLTHYFFLWPHRKPMRKQAGMVFQGSNGDDRENQLEKEVDGMIAPLTTARQYTVSARAGQCAA